MFNDDDSIQLKKNRANIELNLTPLIDAFTVIVLFLVVGAIFSSSDIILPPEMKMPISKSEANQQSAPQLIVFNGKVKFVATDEEFSFSDFSGSSRKVRSSIKKYIAGLTKEERAVGTSLNFTTDRSTPYKLVFDIVKVFKDEGFQTVLFVAEGEQK